MPEVFNIKRLLCLILVVSMFVGPTVLAHPGRTDSSDYHTCRTNCSDYGLEYGEYHTHHTTIRNRTYNNSTNNSESSDSGVMGKVLIYGFLIFIFGPMIIGLVVGGTKKIKEWLIINKNK